MFLGVRLKYKDDNNNNVKKHFDASSPTSTLDFLRKEILKTSRWAGEMVGVMKVKKGTENDKASRFGRGRRGGEEDGFGRSSTRRKQSGRS